MPRLTPELIDLELIDLELIDPERINLRYRPRNLRAIID